MAGTLEWAGVGASSGALHPASSAAQGSDTALASYRSRAVTRPPSLAIDAPPPTNACVAHSFDWLPDSAFDAAISFGALSQLPTRETMCSALRREMRMRCG